MSFVFILGALISDKGGFKGRDIEGLAGDLLKRAITKSQKVEYCHGSTLNILS